MNLMIPITFEAVQKLECLSDKCDYLKSAILKIAS